MKRTVYLPDQLDARVEAYLREHPGASLSGLVQEALEQRLAPREPRAILELAGLVTSASTSAREHAEDRVALGRR
ncbi:MAG TPA: CopG family transcriptional regulator [Chloroflexota bacterium]